MSAVGRKNGCTIHLSRPWATVLRDDKAKPDVGSKWVGNAPYSLTNNGLLRNIEASVRYIYAATMKRSSV